LASEQDEQRWRQFGRLVFATRLKCGFTSQRQFADAAGVHWHTVQKLEAGVSVSRRNPSWAKIEKTLGWEQGAIERVWRGESAKGPGPVAADDFGNEVARMLADRVPELTGAQISKIVAGIEQIAAERGWVIVED
jgi:DNA-binding XRE family transcriptional regulator